MKIAASSIEMNSQYASLYQQEKSENLKVWIGNEPTENKTTPQNTSASSTTPALLLSLSEDFLNAAANKQNSKPPTTAVACCPRSSELDESLTQEDDLKIKLVEDFIYIMTGKKVKIKVPRLSLEGQHADAASSPAGSGKPNPEQAITRQGWGMRYDFSQRIYEKEALSFQATGLVKTSDGREIKLDLSFTMQREFFSQTDIHLTAGDAVKIDPLVISLDGSLPALSQNKFSFDLDSDGTKDQISMLLPGSGFLALDKNQDGIINNGTELFGPQSGDGFAELAKYNSDGNQWIDENDAIFDQLRIWSKDAEGRDTLIALGQVGIGAIYLGHLSTSFSYKNGEETLGELRKTGLVLQENGQANVMQHIDLAI